MNGEEGIQPSLAANRRFGAVPGKDSSLVRKRQQDLGNALEQGREVTPGQVGSTDRVEEEDIAGNREPMAEEGHVPRRVAGDVAHVEATRLRR